MDDYLFHGPAKEREQRLRHLAEAAAVRRRARAATRARRRATEPARSPDNPPPYDDAA
jgi:hypothetical protein